MKSMKEADLLGKLLPGHLNVFPIIENIREKYNIPEVRPEEAKLSSVTPHQVCRLF